MEKAGKRPAWKGPFGVEPFQSRCQPLGFDHHAEPRPVVALSLRAQADEAKRNGGYLVQLRNSRMLKQIREEGPSGNCSRESTYMESFPSDRKFAASDIFSLCAWLSTKFPFGIC